MQICVESTQCGRVCPVLSRFVNPVLACVAVTQEPDDPETEPITALIADRVRRLRRDAGLSQADLAARIAERGPDWGRTTVAKLESGGRKSVSVQELLALALVFDVPPVALIADPRSASHVPIQPGELVNPWAALLWLTGAARIDQRAELSNFYGDSYLISTAWDIAYHLRTLETVERGRDAEDFRRLNDERHRGALEALAMALVKAHGAGAQPPPLPDHVLRRAVELGVELPHLEG